MNKNSNQWNNFFVRSLVCFQHPGGVDLLMEHTGKDCTKAFRNVGHSCDAIRMLKKFKIGILAPPQKSPIDIGHANNIETCIKRKRKLLFLYCC